MAIFSRGIARSIFGVTAARSGAAAQAFTPLSSLQILTFNAGVRLGVAAVSGEGQLVERTATTGIGMASLQSSCAIGVSSRAFTARSLGHPFSSSGALFGHGRLSLWPQAVPVSCVTKSIHIRTPEANNSQAITADEGRGVSESDRRRSHQYLISSRNAEEVALQSERRQLRRGTGQINNSIAPIGTRASNVGRFRGNNHRYIEVHQDSVGTPGIHERQLSSSALLDRFDDNDGSEMDVETYKKMHEISTSGANVPDPVLTFASTEFPPILLKELEKAGFSSPSAIQAMTWPIASKNRDVVAVAKTGSGKTLGYLLPAFLRVERERVDTRHRNPVVLVLAPTRELANQIREEAWKFGRSSRISCTCICGGASKGPQLRDLEHGVDLIVATPGRLNDLLEMNAVNLKRVTYLVLDEADRMLDMGFEPQIRSIVEQMPYQRQTLMYTATWPHEVRRIARDLLTDPVQVNIGNSDQLSANKSITQKIEMISRYDKERRLQEILTKCGSDSKVLIFCTTKRMCEELAMDLRSKFGSLALHGDKSQRERDFAMNQFKRGRTPVLIATDVAARGLDIKDIRMVINYDFPTGVEDYVHRIGRTGRAGATGVAHTFFGYEDAKHAGELVKVLESTGQDVLPELRQMAGRGHSRKGISSRWSGSRGEYGNSKGSNDGSRRGHSQSGHQRGGNDGWKWGQSDRSDRNKYGNNRFGAGGEIFSGRNERFVSRDERIASGGIKSGNSNDWRRSGRSLPQDVSSKVRIGNSRMTGVEARNYDWLSTTDFDKPQNGKSDGKWRGGGMKSSDGTASEDTWGKWN